MAFQNELHNLQVRNSVKNIVILILAIFCLALFFLLLKYPEKLRVDIPPDLSQAQSLKPGYTYPSSVHQFTTLFFQYLNTWDTSGEVDYKDKRNEIRAYITQDFYNALRADYKKKLQSGELKNRRREVKLSKGNLYKPSFVKSKDGYWLVEVTFDLKEYVHNSIVKDVQIRYFITVVQHNVDPIHNPYQIALDSFYAAPEIIERKK